MLETFSLVCIPVVGPAADNWILTSVPEVTECAMWLLGLTSSLYYRSALFYRHRFKQDLRQTV